MNSYTAVRDGYLISTDPALLDLDGIHRYLSQDSYWSAGISRAAVARFVQHSLCFGLYATAGTAPVQVGFARLVTDYTTFAWLADVFILENHRGQGLGKWLVKSILAHPDCQGLRRWMLATRDAHGLYEQFGFHALERPDQHLIRRDQVTPTE